MRNIKSIITTMLGVLFALPALARDFEFEGLTYTVLDEAALTCQTKEGGYSFADSQYFPGNDVSGDLVIPGTVSDGSKSFSVVKIGSYSFARTALTSVVIPESVKTIGVNAFMDCHSLESVSIPESVTSIEPYAFQYTAIRELTLPSSMTEVEDCAFYHCGSLSTINLPESITKIGAYSFFECNSTNRSLTLPSKLEYIGDFAFAQSGITSVELPESLVSVGIGAFGDGFEQIIQASTSSLISVSIPASLKSIGEFAFNKSYYGLDVTYYAEKPEPMPESLFNDETYYRGNTLTMPNANLADIMAVSPWNRFARIIAKDGSIEPSAEEVNFEYNGMTFTVMDAEAKTCRTNDYWWPFNKDNLSSEMFADGLVIPSIVNDGTNDYTVVEIGFQTFAGCEYLTSISLPETLKTIRSQAFISCGNLTSIEIPSSVVNIDQEAFRESGLESIDIPENITYIARGVFHGCKNLTTVNLPDRLTAIGVEAFSECEKIASIQFPNSLIAISGSAFYTSPLSSLSLPESLKAIGAFNFNYCQDSSIELPEGLTSIGFRSFSGLNNFTSLTLPASLKYISSEAFNYNKLKDITYNASNPITALTDIFYVEGAEDYQFNAYKSAQLNMPNATLASTEAVMPWNLFENIKASDGSIGGSLAAGDDFEYEGIWYTVLDAEAKTVKTKEGESSLSGSTPGNNVSGNLVIPAIAEYGGTEYTVVELGYCSFVDCVDLVDIRLPETLQTIANSVFSGCKGLTTIEIPNSVKRLGAAFMNCSNLISVSLPETISIIEQMTFSDCNKLESVILPDGVTAIEDRAFLRCSNLISINFPQGLISIGNSSFDNCSSLKSVDLPEGVSIEEKCFYECKSLETLRLPASLTVIPANAFYGSRSLETIDFSEGLTTIGSGAFYGCLRLKNLVLPKSLTTISSRAFYGSGCTFVSIPASVSEIGGNALYLEQLEEVEYLASKPIESVESIFWQNSYSTVTLNMPNATLADVQATVPWNKFDKIIAKDGSVGFGATDGEDFEYQGVWYTVIDAEAKTCKTKEGEWNNGDKIAGNNCSGDLVIPAVASDGLNDYKVVEIGRYSFWNNAGITSVSIPETVKAFELEAFDECTSLTKAQFATLEALCDINFRSTTSNPLYYAHHLYIGDEEVTEVVFPESMTQVKHYTFDGGSYITSIILHDGINFIGTEAFARCIGLTTIDLPASLTTINPVAFEFCSGLTSIVMPEGLTTIKDYIFEDCTSLTSVTIPGTVTSIGDRVFGGCNAISTVNYGAVNPLAAGSNMFTETVYSNATLNTPNATLEAVQSTVPWSLFKKAVASDGEIGFKDPVNPGEVFEYNYVRYEVVDPAENSCRIVGPVNVSGGCVIPDVVPYNSNEYTVVGIGDESFRDAAYMTYVSFPATIETVGNAVFEGCGQLTVLIWRGGRNMPAGMASSIGNPNLLVYVDEAQYAPESLDHNVVAGGVCDRLVLTPGYPFHPLDGFTANRSSMTKEFMQETAYDGCAGWETIVLPFSPSRITSPEGKTLKPFGPQTDVKKVRPFWLYEADPAGDWMATDTIKAGVPYLIAMPNNPRYNAAYNVQGAVTFSSTAPQWISSGVTSPYAVTWASGAEFHSLWMPLGDVEAASAMGLNVNMTDMRDDSGQLLAPGSAFCKGVEPKPLEAYVTGSSARALPIKGLQTAVMMLEEGDGLTVAQEGSMLMLKSAASRRVEIYAADGTLLRRVKLRAGEAVYVDGLPQGVCLIAGRKVMIR